MKYYTALLNKRKYSSCNKSVKGNKSPITTSCTRSINKDDLACNF